MARMAFEVEADGFNPRIIEAATIPQAVRKFKVLLTREIGKPKRKDTRRQIRRIQLLGPIN